MSASNLFAFIFHEVHEANFSFVCDGKSVQCAKRNGKLDEFDKFYRNWYPSAKARFDSGKIHQKRFHILISMSFTDISLREEALSRNRDHSYILRIFWRTLPASESSASPLRSIRTKGPMVLPPIRILLLRSLRKWNVFDVTNGLPRNHALKHEVPRDGRDFKATRMVYCRTLMHRNICCNVHLPWFLTVISPHSELSSL